VLPLSISLILSFPKGHPLAAYFFFRVFQSYLPFLLRFPSRTCIRRQFPRKITNQVGLPSFYYMEDITSPLDLESKIIRHELIQVQLLNVTPFALRHPFSLPLSSSGATEQF